MTSDKKNVPSKLIISSIIIFIVVLLDQFIKALVLRLGISHACNTGFAFGIFQGILNGLIAFLVLLVVVYFFLTSSYSSSLSTNARGKLSREISSFALALVIGGGASNIFDRLTRGCVVDFITFDFLPRLTWFPLFDVIRSSLTRWPAFNLADAVITAGAGILIFALLKNLKNPDVQS